MTRQFQHLISVLIKFKLNLNNWTPLSPFWAHCFWFYSILTVRLSLIIPSFNRKCHFYRDLNIDTICMYEIWNVWKWLKIKVYNVHFNHIWIVWFRILLWGAEGDLKGECDFVLNIMQGAVIELKPHAIQHCKKRSEMVYYGLG